MGSIYRRGNVLWIKYYKNGVPVRESAETDKEGVARSLLRQREGDVERRLPITPKTNRVLFSELADDVLTDYQVNGKRSRKNVARSFKKHVLPYFVGVRAAAIKPTDVRKYIEQRQAAGAKNVPHDGRAAGAAGGAAHPYGHRPTPARLHHPVGVSSERKARAVLLQGLAERL